jgi:hypothetical protein
MWHVGVNARRLAILNVLTADGHGWEIYRREAETTEKGMGETRIARIFTNYEMLN